MSTTEMVNKMDRVLQGLIDCRLAFVPAVNLTPEQWDGEAVASMKLEAHEPLGQLRLIENSADGSLGFPVNLRGTFAGLAVISGWKRKGRKPLIQLAELVTALLENALEKESRLERRSLMEEKFLVLKSEESNVIQFKPSKSSRVLELKAQIEQMEAEAANAPLVSPLTSLPLLIEVEEGFPLQRVALEIHEQAGRWAFLSLKDLPADVLNSREALKEMGGITLFIPDASTLTMTQQMKLAEYLATKPAGDMPHVIAGLVLRDGETVRLIPHLREQFCSSRLAFTGKSANEITRELVLASLEQIVVRAREKAMSETMSSRVVPFSITTMDSDNAPRLH